MFVFLILKNINLGENLLIFIGYSDKTHWQSLQMYGKTLTSKVGKSSQNVYPSM